MKHGWNTDAEGEGCWDEPDGTGRISEPPGNYLQQGGVTQEIIGAAFEVYNVLGYGFLEKVYQRAMQVELLRRGLTAETEAKIKVTYKGVGVGDYQADLLVNEKVVVELKVAKTYQPDDEPQLLNELKATGLRVGLLINFGRTEVKFRRLVFGPAPSLPLRPYRI